MGLALGREYPLEVATMTAKFFSRRTKAQWGFACNQSADGRLWAGKGYECSLADQLGSDVAEAIAQALEETRGNRNGRFWINHAERVVTLQVGAPHANDVAEASF
jgi:hypothetical protein